MTAMKCLGGAEAWEALDFVRRWAFLLPGWCIRLTVDDWKNGEMGEFASMESDPGCVSATLYIHPGYAGLSATQREETVVHELLHAALAEVDVVWETWSDTLRPKRLRAVARKAYNTATEKAVSHLAHHLVDRRRRLEGSG